MTKAMKHIILMSAWWSVLIKVSKIFKEKNCFLGASKNNQSNLRHFKKPDASTSTFAFLYYYAKSHCSLNVYNMFYSKKIAQAILKVKVSPMQILQIS